MRRIPAWLRSHPLTTIFLAIVGFAVGVHLFANWRAEVRWQRYAAEARARGVKLTLAEFALPEIPDAENFATLPMMRAAFSGGPAPFKLPRPDGNKAPFHNFQKGQRIDFLAWAKFFQDAGYLSQATDSLPLDVLRALEHYAPQFKEWSEWRTRPHCLVPIQFDARGMVQMPAYEVLFNAHQVFTLRMQAHLAAGDPPGALSDFEDALQTYRAFENTPTLIGSMLGRQMLSLLISRLGEGLAQPGWADAELRQLQADLATVNLWKGYKHGFSVMRVSNNMDFERLASSAVERKKLSILFLGSSAASWKQTAFIFIPSRVLRENQLKQNQYIDEHLAKVSADDLRFDPDRLAPSDPETLHGYLDDYYFYFFKHFGEVIPLMGEQNVSAQTKLDQTRLAIALERFRLARGAFPETLAELVPEFLAALPVETYSRQPMIYRRVEGGTFLLYGVGKNRTDDGGVAEAKGSDGEKLDDVWRYAPPVR